MENEILQILLSSLKVQAEKMKELINDSTLSYEQRKNFDTEISEMYNVLASLSNTSIVYSLSEIKILKDTYQSELDKFLESLSNIDLSSITLTPEQIANLKGENGLSAYQIAVNNGFEGSQSEWLDSLKCSVTELSKLSIEISDINELGSTLSQIFQTLGQLQGLVNGGTISGVNINQLDSQFQSFKSSSTSQLDYIMKILQGGEIYNVALETTIQYEGLMNIVESLKSRITDLENNS